LSARRDGQPVPFVPQVDADGNEVAGAAGRVDGASATYTGWNLRNQGSGGRPAGPAADPFGKTAAGGLTGDRTPVADRYPPEAYLARAVCDELVKGSYLLIGDVPQVMRRMEQQWDVASR
jgi:hypothetical protein